MSLLDEKEWRVASRKIVEEGARHSLARQLQAMVRSQTKSRRKDSAAQRAARGLADAQEVAVMIRYHRVGLRNSDMAAKQRRVHAAHLVYLERNGSGREGAPGEMYGPARHFERSRMCEPIQDEERIYRIVVSPENAHELELKQYVREYMKRVESRLGQKLYWSAVNHYDTEQFHSHVLVRGIDTKRRKVALGRQFVTREARDIARELATDRLGPRPLRQRRAVYERQSQLDKYTELDRVLNGRKDASGCVRISKCDQDPLHEAALRKRLDWLVLRGRATKSMDPTTGESVWIPDPDLRESLQRSERYTSSAQTIREVCDVPPERMQVLDADEPVGIQREELDNGADGVVRWKGLDGSGRVACVLETVSGSAYHMPLSKHIVDTVEVGMVVKVKRAEDKDSRIEEAASKQDRVFDVAKLPDKTRQAYARRLTRLEAMSLATKVGDGMWRVAKRFVDKANDARGQRYWQQLSVRAHEQSLEVQSQYCGSVWLDQVNPGSVIATGFGFDVKQSLARRDEYLQALGLSRSDASLRWKLRDAQTAQLAKQLADTSRRRLVTPTQIGSGKVTIHKADNGQSFAEVRSGERFAVVPASRAMEDLGGKRVDVAVDSRGNAALHAAGRDRGRE